jgi:predicted nucleotidyltransferase
MAGLAITPDELAIVKAILAQALPPGYQTFAFGSRATGIRLKPWSDLDLVVEGPQTLSMTVSGQLREAFDESLLPWKVDVVDRRSVSEEFGRIVDADKVSLD